MQNKIKSVLIITKFDGTYMTLWQKSHYIEELRSKGWEIIVFDYNSFRTELIESSLLTILKNKIDFVVWAIQEKPETINFLERLRLKGIPSVLLVFDNTHNQYLHSKSIKFFNLIYLTSPDNIHYYYNHGAKKVMIGAYASNPGLFKPKWRNSVKRVSFIGSIYGYRKKVIQELAKTNAPILLSSSGENNSSKIDLKKDFFNLMTFSQSITKLFNPIQRKLIFSKGLSYFYRSNFLRDLNACDNIKIIEPPNFEVLKNIFEESTLSLNVAELRNTGYLRFPVFKLHLRTFEIPMCGGLQLMRENDLIKNYFEPNKEIILFKNYQDLEEKCKYYLNDKNQSSVLRLKRNAYDRATKEHTWHNRFMSISNELGL